MGTNSSKEDLEDEEFHAKYARGICSSEFGQQWRTHPNYELFQKTFPNSEISKSCISISDKNNQESNPSVMPLSKSKTWNNTPRLQAIGNKQKSYFNQLIEHRAKHIIEADVKKSNDEEMDEFRADTNSMESELKDNGKDGHQILNKPINLGKIAEGIIDLQTRIFKKKQNRNKLIASSSSSENVSRSSSRSWHCLNSEKSSLVGNISLDGCLEHTRSDMTVVPYDLAKARFERGVHKKRQIRNEDYVQLEKLGLGFWNNDQWVPTKVVTLAISDQLFNELEVMGLASTDSKTTFRDIDSPSLKSSTN